MTGEKKSIHLWCPNRLFPEFRKIIHEIEDDVKLTMTPCEEIVLTTAAGRIYKKQDIHDYLEAIAKEVEEKRKQDFPHEYTCGRYLIEKAPGIHIPQIFRLYNCVLNSLEQRAIEIKRKDARDVGAFQHVKLSEGLIETGVYDAGENLGFAFSVMLTGNQEQNNPKKSLEVYASYVRIPAEAIKTPKEFRAFSKSPADFSEDYASIEDCWKQADKTKRTFQEG